MKFDRFCPSIGQLYSDFLTQSSDLQLTRLSRLDTLLVRTSRHFNTQEHIVKNIPHYISKTDWNIVNIVNTTLTIRSCPVFDAIFNWLEPSVSPPSGHHLLRFHRLNLQVSSDLGQVVCIH